MLHSFLFVFQGNSDKCAVQHPGELCENEWLMARRKNSFPFHKWEVFPSKR